MANPPSETDQEVAELATKHLADAGRADLAITGDEVQGWCRRGVLPRPRPRGLGQGKGSRAVYASGTDAVAATAAAFKLALDRESKHGREKLFQRAMLAVATRVGVADHDAFVDAAVDVVGGLIVRARRARRPRKRSEQVSIPGRREPNDALVVDTALDMLCFDPVGRHDLHPDLRTLPLRLNYGQLDDPMEAVTKRLGGSVDVVQMRDKDKRSLFGRVLLSLGLAALRRKARDVSAEEWRWGVQVARSIGEYGATHRELLAETNGGAPVALSDSLSAMSRVLAESGRVFSDDLIVALGALAFLVATPTRSLHRRLDRFAAACRAELPRLRAHLAMARAFDTADRRYLGLGGAVALEQSPESVREAWCSKARHWLAEHRDEAAAVRINVVDPAAPPRERAT